MIANNVNRFIYDCEMRNGCRSSFDFEGFKLTNNAVAISDIIESNVRRKIVYIGRVFALNDK